MKHILFITSLAAVVLATGCKKPAEPAAQSSPNPAVPADKAAAAINDAAHQMPDYTFAQKSDFLAMMQTHVAEVNRSLDEFAATIAQSSSAIKAEAAPKLAALREQAKQLDKQIGTVNSATSSTWSGVKADSEKAYGALKDGLAQSREWINAKIAS